MLFPTVEFALFFLAVLAIAWSLYRLPRAHKVFLLLASYAFYGFWNWAYLLLLIGISVFAGVVAKLIQRSTSPGARKAWLVVGIIVCLATLAYFKYAGFLLYQLVRALGLAGTVAANSHRFSAAAAGHFVFCFPRDLAVSRLLSRQGNGAGAARATRFFTSHFSRS